MSRPQRIEFINAYYHVMNRGAGHRAIFNNDVERELFLNIISKAHTQYNIEIHSYCLMTNHYHLLIKTPLGNLGRAMRHINGIYTQYYNRLHMSDGPLFRGRYKSILLDSDSYLLHLSKYIHLNPLEAKLVDDLSHYKWSSYLAYIGNCHPPGWLFQSEIYNQLTTAVNKNERYRRFMNDEKLKDEVKTFFGKERLSPILGDEAFIKSLDNINQSKEIPRKDRLLKRPTISKIIEETAKEFAQTIEATALSPKGRGRKNSARKLVMYIAQKKYDYRLNEIADSFGLSHYGSVASAISTLAIELINVPALRQKLIAIIKRLDP